MRPGLALRKSFKGIQGTEASECLKLTETSEALGGRFFLRREGYLAPDLERACASEWPMGSTWSHFALERCDLQDFARTCWQVYRGANLTYRWPFGLFGICFDASFMPAANVS